MEENTTAIEPKVLSTVEVKQQVQSIQQILRDEGIMQKGTHYGVIPGCGDKPTLLKPGAEKIMMTFRLGGDPEIDDLSNLDCIRYRVRMRIFSILNGNTVGFGIGEASTDETKYRWRGAISEEEYEAADPNRRRIKFFKSGKTKQVRTEIADQANTVLKMAKKRALVDGVLTATAASDIFTQDLEDMSEENLQNAKNIKPEVKPPQPCATVAKHIISENAQSQMIDIMNEMGYNEKRQSMVFQRAEMVGEQTALDGLSKAYQDFLKGKTDEKH